MSLFSSPAVRIFNSENADSLLQRKAGANNSLVTRKPFVDRTVNCKTPDNLKKQKQKSIPKETIKTASPSTTENLEIGMENYFSYKNVEDKFEDVLLYSKPLEERDVYTFLKRYLSHSTPPPSPTHVDDQNQPFTMTEMDISYGSSYCNTLDASFLGIPEDLFEVESNVIDLPVFDIDNF